MPFILFNHVCSPALTCRVVSHSLQRDPEGGGKAEGTEGAAGRDLMEVMFLTFCAVGAELF